MGLIEEIGKPFANTYISGRIEDHPEVVGIAQDVALSIIKRDFDIAEVMAQSLAHRAKDIAKDFEDPRSSSMLIRQASENLVNAIKGAKENIRAPINFDAPADTPDANSSVA